MSPPPLPHDPHQWPTIDAVCQSLLNVRPDFYITIVDDVIIAVPEISRQVVVSYCQETTMN